MRKPPPADARACALDLLDAVLGKNRLLDEAFDTHPGLPTLPDRDRGFARLLAAETLRRLGQIDALIETCMDSPLPAKAVRARDALRLGICQLLFLDTAPHAAISTSVDLVKHGNLAGYGGLINAVLRRLDREGRTLVAAQDGARLNTPDWLWQSWSAAYGEESAHAIASANLHEAATDITTAGDPTPWIEPLEAERLATGTLRRRAHGDLTQLPGFAEGAWWVQDAAAALPARLLGDVKGKRVVDLCAAPGGKAMQLVTAGAEVTAVDRSAKRLERFRQNLDRLGLTAEVVEADATRWQPERPFDAVLLDAPCSATGTLRRHPDGLRLKRPEDVGKLTDLQSRLLKAAAELVAPGGLLVYCVCSLEPEECSDQIDRLLASGAPLVRRPIRPDEVGGWAETITAVGDLRTLPCHQGGMDGFYAARLERS